MPRRSTEADRAKTGTPTESPSRPDHRARRCAWGVMLLGLLMLAGGCQKPLDLRGEVVADPEPAPPLLGTNWDGQRVALADYTGKLAVVFFGYTLCPDVCPFTLAKMQQVYRQLGPRADDVVMVFVSVDPHRDTIERLARYVPNFDQRFVGIRLEHDELDTVSEAWDLTVQFGQPKNGPGTDSFYYVDHTGTYFVIDQQGHLRVTFPPNATAEDIAADLETLLAS